MQVFVSYYISIMCGNKVSNRQRGQGRCIVGELPDPRCWTEVRPLQCTVGIRVKPG